MSEENVTENQISIPTSDGDKLVNPDLLRGYKDEAFNYLLAESQAKAAFKEVVETVSETTGIPKKDIRKWLKARFDAKVEEQVKAAETIEALEAALENAED